MDGWTIGKKKKLDVARIMQGHFFCTRTCEIENGENINIQVIRYYVGHLL